MTNPSASGFRALGIPLLLLGLTWLAGCAAIQPTPTSPAPGDVWTRFLTQQQALAQAPDDISLSASLYYTTQERTNRTILDLWGRRDYPLRLNIRAGIGASLALMREDETGLLVFYPSEGKAFQHPDSRAAMPAMGLDLPFNLRDLTALLTGPATRLLPDKFISASLVNGTYAFAMPLDSPVAEVRLLADGRLAGLHGRGPRPWRIEVARHKRIEGHGTSPEQLTMDVPSGQNGQNGQNASLRLRSLAFRSEPWEDKALALDLPPGTQLFRIPPANGQAMRE